jgi:hypothetical protein
MSWEQSVRLAFILTLDRAMLDKLFAETIWPISIWKKKLSLMAIWSEWLPVCFAVAIKVRRPHLRPIAEPKISASGGLEISID